MVPILDERGVSRYVLGRHFGLRHFFAITGTAYSAVFVFQGLVPVLLDHFYDVQLIYSHALAGISACLAVGGALLLPLPPYRYDADSRAAAAMHV